MTARDIPIIFSAPMVRGLLEGRKTMTRRLAWRAEPRSATFLGVRLTRTGQPSPWQRVNPGDRLWVRENVGVGYWPQGLWWSADQKPILPSHGCDTFDFAKRYPRISVPSIHMPRWASRLTLVVTGAKTERLHAISEQDCEREGLWRELVGKTWFYAPSEDSESSFSNPREAFMNLWVEINGREAWDSNPEVVAITFAVHQRNIDAAARAA